MSSEIPRTEFDRLSTQVDKIDEKVDRLSESLVQSITELGMKFQGIEGLITSSLSFDSGCRSSYEKKLEDAESRIRKIELNWAKVLGIVLATGSFFSLLSFLISWLD